MAQARQTHTSPIPAELIGPSDPAERERLLNGAEAEIAAGQGIPHEAVRAWLSALAAGQYPAPPCDP